jgi:hypothetical protein
MDIDQRAALIAYLESALQLAEQLQEPATAYLIERALDEARSKSFSAIHREDLPRFN